MSNNIWFLFGTAHFMNHGLHPLLGERFILSICPDFVKRLNISLENIENITYKINIMYKIHQIGDCSSAMDG